MSSAADEKLIRDHEAIGWSQSAVLTTAAICGAALVGGIILAPHVLPALGLSSAELAKNSMFVLHSQAGGYGLAASLNTMLGQVPLIGSELAKGGLLNALAAGVAGIGGVLAGNYISARCTPAPGKTDWGKVIKWAALATSALVALPSVLTGLSYGLIYLAAQLGGGAIANPVIGSVAATTGTIAYDASHAVGVSGIAATLPHLLTCGLSLIPACFTFGMSAHMDRQHSDESHAVHGNGARKHAARVQRPGEKTLPAGDRNHSVTPEQQEMVDAYNNAPPPAKIIMQRWFRERGYNPDFHHDGTMHLYRHAGHHSRA